MSAIAPTPPAPCSWTSPPGSGMTNSSAFATSPAPSCPALFLPQRGSALSPRTSSALPSPSAALPEISRLPSPVRPVSAPGSQRTLTAPAALHSLTPAPTSPARAASLDDTPQFALEGSVFIGGAVIQWLRDEMGFIRTAADSETLAACVRDSAGVHVVPAFVGLGAPHWDSAARGVISGLTRSTNRAHITRAALESIAFQSRDLIDAMETDSGEPIQELRVDGGAAVN